MRLGRRNGDSARSTPFDWIVVGLGNPGPKYARTRHNVGEETVATLASRCDGQLRSGRDDALVCEGRVGDVRAVLAFPITFMNESGRSVAKLVRRYGLEDPARLIVVHDELDLPTGTVRVKVAGGLAGHNGLRSITQHLSTQDYVRVRIGVGRPPSADRGADHVLSRVPAADRRLLDVAVEDAADAVETIITQGADAAMLRFNTRS